VRLEEEPDEQRACAEREPPGSSDAVGGHEHYGFCGP
jgi:hypothetical protein